MKLNKNAYEVLPLKTETQIDEICFASHCDDVEILAFHALYDAYLEGKGRFGAVIATDCGDGEIRQIRHLEQQKAAKTARYGYLAFLNYTSGQIREVPSENAIADFVEILKKFKPKKVYTHNIFDKHDTHVSTALNLIHAIRRLPQNERPEYLYGGEVWRGLDWVTNSQKTVSDLSHTKDFGKKLLKIYKSQNAGGRRYDLGADGRRRANATYYDMYDTHSMTKCAYGLDLTPLITDDNLSISDFAKTFIDGFAGEVLARL